MTAADDSGSLSGSLSDSLSDSFSVRGPRPGPHPWQRPGQRAGGATAAWPPPGRAGLEVAGGAAGVKGCAHAPAWTLALSTAAGTVSGHCKLPLSPATAAATAPATASFVWTRNSAGSVGGWAERSNVERSNVQTMRPGGRKSEIRNPKSEMRGRAAFPIPNSQFLIRAVAIPYFPDEPNVFQSPSVQAPGGGFPGTATCGRGP